MDPFGSAQPRVLQQDLYWKGYKRNKQIESTGEKANTPLIVGLLVGIIFFLFPFIVVAVRRYVFRLRSFSTLDELRQARIEARRQEAIRRAAEMSPGDNHHEDTGKRRDYVANVLKMEKFENCAKAENGEAATLPPSEKSYSDLGHDEEEEGEAAHERCAICLEQFENGDDICVSYNSNCRHIFHYECCFEWVVKNDECPICRRAFLSFVAEDDEQDDAESEDVSDDDYSGRSDANQEPRDFSKVEEAPSQPASPSDSDTTEDNAEP